MKKLTIVSLLFLGLLTTVFIIQSCEKSAHDITINGQRTALEYAYECEAVLGPLPKFKYDDAIEIPMTKNGVPLTQPSDNANDCDHPFAFNAPCDPANRMGRYQGINPDGTENSDVVFVTFFRGSGLGVIGYKYSTGETCFFEVDELRDRNNIPQPQDADYNQQWAAPADIAQGTFNCVNCHMASPFLHTPAVDQVRNPADTSELLLPVHGFELYTIVGQEWQQPHTTDIQNSCTSCHRPQCTDHFQNYPLDELVMPPPFQNATDFDHSNISNADRQAIRDWCKTLGL